MQCGMKQKTRPKHNKNNLKYTTTNEITKPSKTKSPSALAAPGGRDGEGTGILGYYQRECRMEYSLEIHIIANTNAHYGNHQTWRGYFGWRCNIQKTTAKTITKPIERGFGLGWDFLKTRRMSA